MKKIYISSALLILSIFGYGQSLQLSFTGLDAINNNHIQIDSILITNLTKECDTTLYSNDTVLVLFPTGINDIEYDSKSFNLIENYPNPFHDITNFGLKVSQKERIVIQLFTMVGQKVAEYDRIFNPGVHLFSCEGTPGNFYLLTASNGVTISSLKLLSTSNSKANGARIKHIAHTSEQPVYKKATSVQKFSFSFGDQLECTGFSSGYIHSIIIDIPQTNTDYVLLFESPYIFSCGDSVLDERDGRIYQTIEVGTQCWLAENLNIGTQISGDQNQQDNSEIEKYCYDNNENNCDIYGGLYQWDEMMQYDTNRANKGICPLGGWRLPSIVEWDTLLNYLGGTMIAGEAMMQGGTSGFEALLGGKRGSDGQFSNLGIGGYFSSTRQTDNQTAWYRYLLSGDPGFYAETSFKSNGYSVRCIKGYPNRLNPLVVIIDTNVYMLLSDSLELSQGIYRYEILDKQKQDTIGNGNIIIGITGAGYLREVIDATQLEEELILTTEQANIEEVWESGEYSFNLNLWNGSTKYNQYSVIDFLEEGVTVNSDSSEALRFDFDSVTLYQSGPLTITIPEGHFELNPDFEVKFVHNWWEIEKLEIYSNNTIFETFAKLNITSTGQLQTQFSKQLGSKTFYITTVIMAGEIPIPIVIAANAKLMAYDTITVEATLNVASGYTNKKKVSFGFRYNSYGFSKIWDLATITDSIHPPDYNVVVSFTNKLSLVPEISIKLYDVIGPYFNIDLYKKYIANYSLIPPNNWDMAIRAGLSPHIGVDGKAISEKIFWDKAFGPFEWPIWNFPDSVIYIQGNDQTGQTDEILPDSLIIKVVDNYGEGWPLIPATYNVISGDGSVSDSVATTSIDGFARTAWTLGPDAGQNTVEVSVRKSDLTHIKESPYVFNASAISPSEPCPGIPIVVYEGQVYNTVQVGDQCWLKENLNVGTMLIGGTQNMTNNEIIEKFCYYNDPANCEIYGGLYTWFEVMQWTQEEGAQGICPEGWHLPTDDEWKVLEGTVDSQYPVGDPYWDLSSWRGFDAGYHLKSTNLWDNNGFGDDAYDFSALPGGILPVNPVWSGLNDVGDFWSSSMVGLYNARVRTLAGSHDDINRMYLPKDVAISVRCLKD